jgi:hypothetical protein
MLLYEFPSQRNEKPSAAVFVALLFGVSLSEGAVPLPALRASLEVTALAGKTKRSIFVKVFESFCESFLRGVYESHPAESCNSNYSFGCSHSGFSEFLYVSTIPAPSVLFDCKLAQAGPQLDARARAAERKRDLTLGHCLSFTGLSRSSGCACRGISPE